MASQKLLESTRITTKGDLSTQVPAPTFTMVAGGGQCAPRSTIIPSKACSANLCRRIKRRLGAYLDKHTARVSWSLPECKLHINYLELKAVFLALKEFQDLCFAKIVLVATDKVGSPVCPTVENLDLVYQETSNSQSPTYPRLTERGSRQAIQA